MGAKGHHQDHYEVLGVPPEAGDQAIRDAYRWLARKFHPDQNVDGDGRADTMMKRVNVAYGVLGDPIKRRAYDRLRGAGEEAPPPAPPHEAPKAGAPQPEAERVADVEDVEDVEHEDSRIRTCGNCGAIVALDATRCAKCWAKLGANEPSRTQSRTSADGPRRKAPSRVARGPRRKAPNGLRRVLKIIAWLVAVVLFGVGAVVVYAVFDDHERTAEREAVKLSAEYDPNRCSTDHPILVTIANGSMRTVREVRFELEAYEEGRSDNLFGYNGQRTWTAVIPPGNTSPSCWSAPSFSRDVTGGVTVRAKIGWVELYARNEFIPPGPAPVPSAPAPVSPAPMETGRKGGDRRQLLLPVSDNYSCRSEPS